MAASSALNFLNKKAVDKCSYLSFAKLMPGRYAVSEFFIKIDKKFDKGQKRLCLKIDDGKHYLMLPKRYMDQDGESPSLENLNSEPCVFVFEGKKGEYDLNFSFEAAVKPADQTITDEDDEVDEVNN